jgi:Holliday junction DNA helicase RuvB
VAAKTDPNRFISGRGLPEESRFEQSLRPRRFEDFVGQPQIKENLRVYVEAAKQRREALDHVLFSGPPGLGKTTLSHIIADSLGTHLHATTGPALERPADLVGILTNLERGDVLFIDEVHRLGPAVEEYLYAAMEDFRVDVVIDSGPSARSISLDVPRFTLVGATTREGLLTGSFRARFGVVERLDFYPPGDLKEIVVRSATILGCAIEESAADLLASCARGTPRVANRFLRRIRDVAQVAGSDRITVDLAQRGLTMLGIDEHGLCELDRQILRAIARGGAAPVGVKTIAVTVGETEDTIEEVYEPFLIREGFLQKTPRGRTITGAARKVLGPSGGRSGQTRLFEE